MKHKQTVAAVAVAPMCAAAMIPALATAINNEKRNS
jgi:hypothetical protein